jgi:hypothetical protein
MRSYSLNELFRLTRHELFALHAEIVALQAGLPDDAPERHIALATLRLIRRVLARPALTP